MSKLFGKCKGHGKNTLVLIAAQFDDSLYSDLPETPDKEIAYDIETLLDDNQWFKSTNFASSGFCPDYLAEFKNGKQLNTANQSSFDLSDNVSLLKHIIWEKDNLLCFQAVIPSSVLQKKTLWFRRQTAELVEKPNFLVVNPLPDAIYYRDSDILLFKDIARANRLFPGMDSLFREATKDEVKEFKEKNTSWSDNSSEFNFNISKRNLKRIALVMEVLDALGDAELWKLNNYVQTYIGGQIEYDQVTGLYKPSNDYELGILLDGYLENFYTTPVTKEKRRANSVVKLQ